MRSRRWPWVVLAVIAGLWLAKHFLLDTAAAAGASYAIDLEALHRVAIASGPLPERIEVEKVGEFKFPRTIVVAHDPVALQEDLRAGLFQSGFSER